MRCVPAEDAAGKGGADHAGRHEAAEDHAVRQVLAVGAERWRPLREACRTTESIDLLCSRTMPCLLELHTSSNVRV